MTETEFKELSPAEFWARNKQFSGFDNPIKAAYTTFRELFENSLDACEGAKIQPKIEVQIEQKSDVYTFAIVDNGSGVPPNYVPDAFGKIFFGSKYLLKQHRGELGMGGKMALLNSLIETNRPFRVVTSEPDDNYIWIFDMSIDLKKNAPILHEHPKCRRKTIKWHGTAIKLYSKSNFKGALNRILTYLDMTTTICPYITVSVKVNGEEVHNHIAKTNILPPVPKVAKYHPHGIDTTILRTLIEKTKAETMDKFLLTSFQRIGLTTVKDFLAFAGIPQNKNPKTLQRDEIVKLVEKLKSYEKFLAPDTSCLSPVTEEIFLTGVKEKYKPEFSTYSMRRGVCEGHPFIIECVVAIGNNIPTSVEKNELPDPFRYANKIPLLYDKATCALQKAAKEIFPSMYKLTDGTKIGIWIHLCSTHIPYKTAGKEYISPDYEEINKQIGNALKDCLRSVRDFMSKRIHEEQAQKRKSIFDIYLPIISSSLSTLSEKHEGEVLEMLRSVI